MTESNDQSKKSFFPRVFQLKARLEKQRQNVDASEEAEQNEKASQTPNTTVTQNPSTTKSTTQKASPSSAEKTSPKATSKNITKAATSSVKKPEESKLETDKSKGNIKKNLAPNFKPLKICSPCCAFNFLNAASVTVSS